MTTLVETRADEIVIVSPPEHEHRYALPGMRMVLGRSSDADIRFDSPMVSRRHAELAQDPDGQWWLSDLCSHNGTHINGHAVTQQQLQHLDQIQVGDLICVYHGYSQSRDRSDTISVAPPPVMDRPAGTINTISEFWSSTIRAEQLSLVVRFADRLLEIDEPSQRLVELCRLLVGPEFHGLAAVCLRISVTDTGSRPELLCEAQNCGEQNARLPYLSHTLLNEVRVRKEACLASMGRGDDQAVELTVMDDTRGIAVLACPIQVEAGQMDLLYVEVPVQFGTGDWLALVVLSVEQFHHAHESWKSRLMAVEQAAIDRELELARDMQRGLLPEDLRSDGLLFAIGFEPCRWVGGDYVDVLARPDGGVILVIADVCGKGVQAALVTTALHSRLHANLDAGLGLVDAISSINEYLTRTLPSGHFVTMIGLELDLGTGQIQCVNAGHPPPMVVRADGSTRRLNASPALPLGITTEVFPTSEDRVGVGDYFLLYTDGVTETFDPEGHMLGIEGVERQLGRLAIELDDLNVRSFADEMMARLKLVRSGGLVTDDTSLLVATMAEHSV